MAKWFVEIDGTETGPLSSTELKELASNSIVTPDTKVRTDSSMSWSVASKIKGLAFHVQVPPPLPPTSEVEPQSNSVTVMQGDSRECPFCFEIIKAKAEKCRYCGEFLKSDTRDKETVDKRISTIADRQRILLLCILATILAGPFLLLIMSIDPSLFWLSVLVLDVGCIIIAMNLSFACYEEKAVGALLSILTVLPLIGWIFVVVINGKATSILEANGLKVGLLGAKQVGIQQSTIVPKKTPSIT